MQKDILWTRYGKAISVRAIYITVALHVRNYFQGGIGKGLATSLILPASALSPAV